MKAALAKGAALPEQEAKLRLKQLREYPMTTELLKAELIGKAVFSFRQSPGVSDSVKALASEVVGGWRAMWRQESGGGGVAS